MRPRDFAPDNPDLGPSYFSVRSVNKCDFLAKVESVDLFRLGIERACVRRTDVAALGSSTPSILIKLASCSAHHLFTMGMASLLTLCQDWYCASLADSSDVFP